MEVSKPDFYSKDIYIILVLLVITPLLGFGNDAPERVLTKYLKSLYSNNLKKTYNYISKADKETISKSEFVKQNTLDGPFLKEMSKTIYELSKYQVNDVNINGNKAIVDITTVSPDMSRVLAAIFGPFHGPKDMEDPQEATRNMLKQYLKKGDVPMARDTRKFVLLEEDGKWKIFLDLKNRD